jgi:hypothetical protein
MPTFDITTIELSGSTGTTVDGIAASGALVGSYSNSTGSFFYIAENGTVASFDVPASIRNGITISGFISSGEIVGTALQLISLPQPPPRPPIVTQIHRGFIGINGTISAFDAPVAPFPIDTVISGINDSGEIAGTYTLLSNKQSHGFVDSNGVFTTIDFPGSISTKVTGINEGGEIVGIYSDSTGVHGFTDINGVFTNIGLDAISIDTIKVNDSGGVFGQFFDGSAQKSFVDLNGTITTVDVPGSISTDVVGVNDRGEVVGTYTDSTGNHGFADINGVLTTIDPAGSKGTSILGVNDSGEIVGDYSDGTGSHGFTATEGPPTEIVGTLANQTTTDAKAVRPFAGVVIAAPSVGTPTETVTVRPSDTANGTLSDPNAASDGSTISNGVFTITGATNTVTTALEGLVFTPTDHQLVPGQSVTTGFEIRVENTLGQLDLTKTDDTTSVIATAVNDPPTLISPALSYTVAEGQTLQNVYAQLLANAQDVDLGDQAQLTVSTLGLSNSAGFLYFDAGDRMLTYTADGFNTAKPVDRFTYTISDPQGATVTGTVDVTVTGPALPTQVGSAGADRLTADGSGHRLIGGDGNDKLIGHGENQLIFGGRGDDTITADGNSSTV